MGESVISQQPATLPQNLPDLRTAQRLLDVLSQLEQTLRVNPPQAAGAAPGSPALQEENARLKAAQTQALQRLETLLGKLRRQADEPAEEAA